MATSRAGVQVVAAVASAPSATVACPARADALLDLRRAPLRLGVVAEAQERARRVEDRVAARTSSGPASAGASTRRRLRRRHRRRRGSWRGALARSP